MQKKKLKIKSLNELEKFINKFFLIIPKETVICLFGELGVGKTQFTKFFAKKLGINEEVVSPTFSKMNLYYGKKGNLVHIDAFSIKEENNVYEFIDYFDDKYVIIEWPKIFKKKLNSFFVININIKYLNNNERELEVCANERIIKFL